SKEPFPDLVLEITRQALKRGLIVIRAGLYSNCIRLLPPLDLTDDEIDEGMGVLAEAVTAAVGTLVPEFGGDRASAATGAARSAATGAAASDAAGTTTSAAASAATSDAADAHPTKEATVRA